MFNIIEPISDVCVSLNIDAINKLQVYSDGSMYYNGKHLKSGRDLYKILTDTYPRQTAKQLLAGE